jgi:amidase
MYPVPDIDAVLAVAKTLGLHLSPEEAALYQKYIVDQLQMYDSFVQSRVEESRPPMASATRQPGYRPTPTEDPLNAWVWKCRIEGTREGPLAGKTVSFKDHIAVAGMPMSFGSFALDGFVPDVDATIVTRVLQAGGAVIGKNVMNGLSGGFGTGGGGFGAPGGGGFGGGGFGGREFAQGFGGGGGNQGFGTRNNGLNIDIGPAEVTDKGGSPDGIALTMTLKLDKTKLT